MTLFTHWWEWGVGFVIERYVDFDHGHNDIRVMFGPWTLSYKFNYH
jgi:hypothetical protein